MRRLTVGIVLLVAAGLALATRAGTTTDASAVEGVWKIVHSTVTNEQGTVEEDIDEPNLTIFTGSHFASVFPGDGVNHANAGTYEVKGNEIHLRVVVATFPDETPEGSATFDLDGDTLVLTFTTADSGTLSVTSTRVE